MRTVTPYFSLTFFHNYLLVRTIIYLTNEYQHNGEKILRCYLLVSRERHNSIQVTAFLIAKHFFLIFNNEAQFPQF